MEDIVESLRAMATIVEAAQGKMTMTMVSGRIFDEAADEIERLRALGDSLAQGVRTGRYDAWLDAWDDHRAELLKVEQRKLTDAERQEIRQAFHLD